MSAEQLAIRIGDIVIGNRKRELNKDKVEELADSFKLIGQLEPITVTQKNGQYILLAGLHRLEAAKLLGWESIEAKVFTGNELECELVEIDENLMNNNLTVLEQAEHLKRRNEILEALGVRAKRGDNQYTLGTETISGPEKGETVSPFLTTEDIGKEVGLTGRSIRQRIQIARDILPEVKEKIRNTPIADSTTQLLELARLDKDMQLKVADLVNEEKTLTDIKKEIKKIKREQEIEELKKKIEESAPAPLTMEYDVIVIDPPWPYGTEYDPDGRRAASPYPEMSLDEIKAIELPASENCVLWLWTTHKFMRYAFEVIDAWGFREVAILTWVKDRIGLGTWLRSQTEFCIMAVKGSPKVNLTNQSTVIYGKLREHSRKPDEFYEMVDSLCIGRKLDYFSREKREGWDQYGNDTQRFG